ncbi:MAG: GspMb/PilO family protein [Brevinematales bacterium]
MKTFVKRLISLVLLMGTGVAIFVFVIFFKESRYLAMVWEQQRNVGDIVFLKRTVSSLKTEYENLIREGFDSRTSADFIANLPVLAEFSGIERFTMQTRGTGQEGKQEIMTVEMTMEGRFASIASFVDILERSRLPIQIETLIMERALRVSANMTIRIYYRR